MEESCKTCKYMRARSHPSNPGVFCCYNPPVILMSPTAVFTGFVKVEQDEWCGKYATSKEQKKWTLTP